METILELFATLHAAIDRGVMTQELIAFAALAIAHRMVADWNARRITAEQLGRVSREMEHLNLHWSIACPWPAVQAEPSQSHQVLGLTGLNAKRARLPKRPALSA